MFLKSTVVVHPEIKIQTGDNLIWVDDDVNSHTITTFNRFQNEDELSSLVTGES